MIGTADRPPDASGRYTLSEEDERLWLQVARTAKPLPKHRNAPPTRTANPPSPPSPLHPAKPRRIADPPRCVPQPRPPSRPQMAAVDRRSARQIATGQLEIDARLDLHGMRQSQAHAQLRSFIARAQDGGARHVLIITGKGGPRMAEEGERGILKRSVPVWLTEPPLDLAVIGWSPAHRRHGGEGAIYVRLRRSRSAGVS